MSAIGATVSSLYLEWAKHALMKHRPPLHYQIPRITVEKPYGSQLALVANWHAIFDMSW